MCESRNLLSLPFPPRMMHKTDTCIKQASHLKSASASCSQISLFSSISEVFGGKCSPLAEPSRLLKLPSTFIPGCLQPRSPSWGPTKLSLAIAYFSYLFGSKNVEENSKPVPQWLSGNTAGVVSGWRRQGCLGPNDSLYFYFRVFLHQCKTMITFPNIYT